MPDLRLREKVTRRTVRVLTRQPIPQQVAPLSNLLQDCHVHGGGLVEPRGNKEFVAISAAIVAQDGEEITVSLDVPFAMKVIIQTAGIDTPPVSVWCYIGEYSIEIGSLGVRLRQKMTGRKVEMYGKNKDHLAQFLASPRFTGARELMPNLYEKDGFDDYVLVSGGTAVDSYDVIRFQDNAELAYLLGPSPGHGIPRRFPCFGRRSGRDSTLKNRVGAFARRSLSGSDPFSPSRRRGGVRWPRCSRETSAGGGHAGCAEGWQRSLGQTQPGCPRRRHANRATRCAGSDRCDESHARIPRTWQRCVMTITTAK